MVLWTKLWYYTENYGTSIYEEKKTWWITIVFYGQNYSTIPKTMEL